MKRTWAGAQLKPGLVRLRRSPGAVQIGLDPRFGVVLTGLTEADEAFLDRLSSELGAASSASDAGRTPAPAGGAPRSGEILRLLTESKVLVRRRAGRAALAVVGPRRDQLAADARVWSVVHGRDDDGWALLAERARRRIDVHGRGRTAEAVVAALSAAGVGQVRFDDAHAGDGSTSIRQHRPGDGVPSRDARRGGRRDGRSPAGDSEPGGRRPHLVILVDHGAADVTRADPLVAADVPHLSVVVGEAGVTVGPLVVPGLGPCLRCLELHRSESDPTWPRLLAQLLCGACRDLPADEAASAGLAGSLAALQALGHLDGVAEPAAAAATLEIALPDGLVARRPWPTHPSCGCHWPPAEPALRLPGAEPPTGTTSSDPPGPGPGASGSRQNTGQETMPT